MMMVLDTHLLHRLFAIEERLKLPGSIVCLEQLRQALNSEASFRDSIAKLIRDGGFNFSNPMFSAGVSAGVSRVPPVAAACGEYAAPNAILKNLTSKSKSQTKIDFMNTAQGIKLRHENGAHVEGSDRNHSGSCMLCGARTCKFCITCSQACRGKNNEKVQFNVCSTDSQNVAGRRNIYTCFQLMHSANELVYDAGREKCTSENHSRSLSDLNAAKRIRIGDGGATQPQDGATPSQDGATLPQFIESENEGLV